MTNPNTRRSWRCLVAMAFFSLSACSNHTELTSAASSTLFKTLDGEKFSLNDLPGPKLVNFWSTSCHICLKEMPDLVELHEDYESRGFTVIAVAMPSDRPDLVLEVSQQRKLPFPVALDLDGKVLSAFKTEDGKTIKGTPTTFLINADGDLLGRYVGKIKFDVLREKLDKLLTVSHIRKDSIPTRLAAAAVSS